MFDYPSYGEGSRRRFIFFAHRSSKRFVKTRLFEDIELHEILLDSLAKKRKEELGFSERKFEVPLPKKILQGFFLFCLLIILGLFLRTFQFQIVEGKKFSELSQENKFIISRIQAERGVIYDQNLEQLVFNQSSFDLVCEDEITVEDLDHQTLILYETKINEMPECEIKNNSLRDYPDGLTFSHIIGYTGKIKAEEFKEAPDSYSINDWVGRAGIENFYEDVLRKNPGKLRIERDALGNIISKEIISLPESGESLVLWLDSGLQEKIKTELEKVLKAIGSKKAVAIALDPKTGGVISLVSIPSFDNNLFQKGADPEKLQELLEDPFELEPLFNRAISGRYVTGSTIKPLIASAVLEEKIISPEKKIYDDKGFIEIPHQYDPEKVYTYKDWTIHGWTDMRKAIAESCNVYFYTVGGGYEEQDGLGPTKIKQYLDLFGWGSRTGIDLPWEAKGFIPDIEWKKNYFEKKEDQGWWDGDTYNLSIGQGYLLVTPLEVAVAFSAIANGGTLYQPQVVKEIVDKEKNLIEEFKPKIVRQDFINPENLQVVREGMRQAVTGLNSPQASAIMLNSLPVQVAAKTGTAELGNNYYHNWVTVFAPYQDPEIVLTIMIENVKELQAVVVPLSKVILEWYFTSE